MDDKEQKRAAKKFVEFWHGKGYEKGQTQSFWLSLLREVFGVAEPEKVISFEDQIVLKNTNFIDAYIPSTRVLIEQKGSHIDLTKKIKQSDGSMLTPYQQARRYISGLSYSIYPRWIVVESVRNFVFIGCTRLAGSDYPMDTKFLTLSLLQKEREFGSINGNLSQCQTIILSRSPHLLFDLAILGAPENHRLNGIALFIEHQTIFHAARTTGTIFVCREKLYFVARVLKTNRNCFSQMIYVNALIFNQTDLIGSRRRAATSQTKAQYCSNAGRDKKLVEHFQSFNS